jgi:hypothetical protein
MSHQLQVQHRLDLIFFPTICLSPNHFEHRSDTNVRSVGASPDMKVPDLPGRSSLEVLETSAYYATRSGTIHACHIGTGPSQNSSSNGTFARSL